MPHINIDHIARLARLDLTPAEKAQYTLEIERVLNYMDAVAAADIPAGTLPMAYAGAARNVLRDDLPQSTFSPEEALLQSPAQREGCWVVPAVV